MAVKALRAGASAFEGYASSTTIMGRAKFELEVLMMDMLRELDRYAGRAWRAYELGEADLFEALNARKSAHEARREAASSRLDVHQSAARLLLDGHRLWSYESSHAAH